MAVEQIKEYRQQNGEDILKVILKPTKNYPNGYFYADAIDEKLVKEYTWYLLNQKHSYIVASYGDMSRYQQLKLFHQEKAFNILSWYPDYINHISGIEFDNIDRNLDVVSQQQNCWSKPSRGYVKDKRYKNFQPRIAVNQQMIYASRVKSEVEVCQSVYQLEMTYENYRYDFLKDRRKDLDILDLERTGKISEEEAVYNHVVKYAINNAWYYYRYNLAQYFKDNHIPVPAYALDSDGFMTHPITGQRLCPI